MEPGSETRKTRRLTNIAAGNCGKCAAPRETPAPGGATNTLCATCAIKARVADKRSYETRVASGLCNGCGKPRGPKERGGATAFYCAVCANKQRARDTDRSRAQQAAGKCTTCQKPREPQRPGRATTHLCAACAKKHRLRRAVDRSRKRIARADIWGATPTGEPGFCGKGAKPLGPSRYIRFPIDEPTMKAIWELKRRYREAHPGYTSRYHVSEIIRTVVAKWVRKGGSSPPGYQPFVMPGWYCAVRFPLALYNEITQIANKRCGGSRAKAVRFAIRQEVTPVFIGQTAGRRRLGGNIRYEWEK